MRLRAGVFLFCCIATLALAEVQGSEDAAAKTRTAAASRLYDARILYQVTHDWQADGVQDRSEDCSTFVQGAGGYVLKYSARATLRYDSSGPYGRPEVRFTAVKASVYVKRAGQLRRIKRCAGQPDVVTEEAKNGGCGERRWTERDSAYPQRVAKQKRISFSADASDKYRRQWASMRPCPGQLGDSLPGIVVYAGDRFGYLMSVAERTVARGKGVHRRVVRDNEYRLTSYGVRVGTHRRVETSALLLCPKATGGCKNRKP